MFNIIEQQVKLNMKTEAREERTLETPMVEDCMRQSLPPLLRSRQSSSLWWNGCVAAKGWGKVRKYGRMVVDGLRQGRKMARIVFLRFLDV